MQNPAYECISSVRMWLLLPSARLPERSFDLLSVSVLFPVVQFSTKPQRHCQVDENVFTVEAVCLLKSQESDFLCTFSHNVSFPWVWN